MKSILRVVENYDTGGYNIENVKGKMVEVLAEAGTRERAEEYLEWYAKCMGYKLEDGQYKLDYKKI